MRYRSNEHSAKHTGDYVFSQLIPYIGNKRKLLGLIRQAIDAAELNPHESSFLDAFSGSGVVSRFAKKLGFAVTSNDWEPYAEALGKCFIETNEAPLYFGGRTYELILQELNGLPPVEGWVTKHLCPSNDVQFDIRHERMFYMRKNGMRIDAVRERIAAWDQAGHLDPIQRAALLGPLIYQACWLSNTSGVFKGFHNGWGGKTGTALYRICADFSLSSAIFFDNHRRNHVARCDSTTLAQSLTAKGRQHDFVYLDPPYNQHPYGSNYHVLNTVTLWDKPTLPERITGHGDKSAIRRDWRTERRSCYNDKRQAATEYARLMDGLSAHWICTSYSTDGYISLRSMLAANHHRGESKIFLQGYKRYRVSSQRFSEKPMNVEFVVLTDTTRRAVTSIDEHHSRIMNAEETVLSAHSELQVANSSQGSLFDCG